jgi:hypothetical protein
MGFEQATLRVEKQQEFERLQSTITRCCAAENLGKFLKAIRSAGLRVRDVEGVLAKGILDGMESSTAGTMSRLYQALTVSDQAQIREFYLFKVEEIDPKLRAKFHKLYQYY